MNEVNFDIWSYLIQVAPVVLVMGIGIKALWDKNNKLTDELRKSDLQNLETLQHLSTAIQKNNDDGNRNFEHLKEHISERTESISKQIEQRR